MRLCTGSGSRPSHDDTAPRLRLFWDGQDSAARLFRQPSRSDSQTGKCRPAPQEPPVPSCLLSVTTHRTLDAVLDWRQGQRDTALWPPSTRRPRLACTSLLLLSRGRERRWEGALRSRQRPPREMLVGILEVAGANRVVTRALLSTWQLHCLEDCSTPGSGPQLHLVLPLQLSTPQKAPLVDGTCSGQMINRATQLDPSAPCRCLEL
ncbi:hypothetical protein BDV96DRAFT_31288 [Lophiotrema nucula]|uniref:Uncharacterized protein n=1 Tax=Lophiotrema nucula TaxID=690887 RepID=A0A6A5ZAS4_9PLEO|nr:hypothetical protein BDV96DRAFT_31288 [Lophiotrema nucula]